MSRDLAEQFNTVRAAPPLSRKLVLGRTLWISIHGAIGLVLGAAFVVIGLTGSLLAYWQTIDEWINPAIMRVEIPLQGSHRPLDEILAAARTAIPSTALIERLKTPRHRGAAAAVTYMVAADDLSTDCYETFVDPYTARVTGTRVIMRGDDLLSQPFVHVVMDLHWTLLLGYDKAYAVGALAIPVLLSTLAGFYLWWPRNGNWRRALTVKMKATPARIILDLHKTIGLYLGPVLLVLLLTGMMMIFKPLTRSVVEIFSPIRPEPQNLRSTPVPGQAPIGLDAAARIADEAFPDGRLHWILVPGGPQGAYLVGKQADAEPNRASTYRSVAIDQYTGRIVHIQDRKAFTAGERFMEWLYPLHCGEAFGNAGRALIMAAGFAPLILYVTGLLRWRQKRAARRQNQKLELERGSRE